MLLQRVETNNTTERVARGCAQVPVAAAYASYPTPATGHPWRYGSRLGNRMERQGNWLRDRFYATTFSGTLLLSRHRVMDGLLPVEDVKLGRKAAQALEAARLCFGTATLISMIGAI